MSQELHNLIENLTQLVLPIPPMLEAAMGYPEGGVAKFVAFYWLPAGDEACFDDGQLSGTGEYEGYLFYPQHSAVWPKLKGYDFGSSDNYGQHQLLLDREMRQFYAGTNDAVSRVLFEQWQGLAQNPPGAEAVPLEGPSETAVSPTYPLLALESLREGEPPGLAEVAKLLGEFGELQPPTEEQIAAYRTHRRQIMAGLAQWLAAAKGLE